MSPEERAQRIHALQSGFTHAAQEREIVELLLEVEGLELTRVKNLIDLGADHRDLMQLVHHDIDNNALRDTLLSHFRKAVPQQRGLKVLSDIDDTLYANWKDKRFPAKTLYPGVTAFYRALVQEPAPPASLVTFITARPDERSGLIEGLTHNSLRRRAELEHITILSGSVLNLHSNAAIARKKIANFEAYADLFPEYRFVFVGDSGQGDAVLAAAMLESRPESVPACFIHDVVDTPEDARSEAALEGIHFFDTYVGAAIQAHRLQLVNDDALAAVIQQAVEDMASIDFEGEAVGRARVQELERDVKRASQALSAHTSV